MNWHLNIVCCEACMKPWLWKPKRTYEPLFKQLWGTLSQLLRGYTVWQAMKTLWLYPVAWAWRNAWDFREYSVSTVDITTSHFLLTFCRSSYYPNQIEILENDALYLSTRWQTSIISFSTFMFSATIFKSLNQTIFPNLHSCDGKCHTYKDYSLDWDRETYTEL